MRILDQAAQALRTIGRLLDSKGAGPARISRSGDDEVEVAWEQDGGLPETWTFSELDIERLRAQAPLARGTAPTNPQRGEREELMRTLGQELDALGVQVDEIVESDRTFQVKGTANGESVFRFYAKDELRELSVKRRALRQPPG